MARKGLAARASLLDYTQCEFTVAVGLASEAGGPDESGVLGYVGNPQPGQGRGNLVSLSV